MNPTDRAIDDAFEVALAEGFHREDHDWSCTPAPYDAFKAGYLAALAAAPADAQAAAMVPNDGLSSVVQWLAKMPPPGTLLYTHPKPASEDAVFGWVLTGPNGATFVPASHRHVVDAMLQVDGCTAVVVYTHPASGDADIYEAYKSWPEDIRKKLSNHDLRRMSGWAPRPNPKDWRIDHSAGRPILMYAECSVIEAETARYVLSLVAKDASGDAVAWLLDSDTPKDRVSTTCMDVVETWRSGGLKVVPLSRGAMDAEHWAELHRLRAEATESKSGLPWRTIAAQERAKNFRPASGDAEDAARLDWLASHANYILTLSTGAFPHGRVVKPDRASIDAARGKDGA